jgi:phosphatidylinositol kinase/protein kinase (PI-3  family)
MEKVECWLNPYEILSTGNSVGVIECVPNTLSIDQLKKKITGTTRQFFEGYFGPTNSDSNL